MKPLFTLLLVFCLHFMNGQNFQKKDTLYFKFDYNRNQEIVAQKTIKGDIVGLYYYNYFTKDKFNFVMFTFMYSNSTFLTEKKSTLKKRKIKYLDYNFLKSKPLTELNEFFNNKVVLLLDSKESGCEVKLKKVTFQSSLPSEM